ncbi:MAG TPA: hypothetical protein VJT78_10760 [Candidatus Dormibacteraeota bacterium]|nr:hypothetical protein [Candidatus Dormibacteraeota bacterium]
MAPIRRWFVTLSVAGIAVACGGLTPAAPYDQTASASQIAKDSAGSLKSVKSEHIKFDGTTSNGQVGLEADVEGQNFNGTISLSGQTLKVIGADGKVYIYGPDILTLIPGTDPAAAARLKVAVGTNWVVLPNSSTVTSDLGPVLDLTTVSTCISGLAGLKKKGTSNIDGDAVVEVDDSTGGQVFVLISSPHYPRRIVLSSNTCATASNSGAGTVEMTKENAHFGIKAPTNVVDLASLSAGG